MGLNEIFETISNVQQFESRKWTAAAVSIDDIVGDFYGTPVYTYKGNISM